MSSPHELVASLRRAAAGAAAVLVLGAGPAAAQLVIGGEDDQSSVTVNREVLDRLGPPADRPAQSGPAGSPLTLRPPAPTPPADAAAPSGRTAAVDRRPFTPPLPTRKPIGPPHHADVAAVAEPPAADAPDDPPPPSPPPGAPTGEIARSRAQGPSGVVIPPPPDLPPPARQATADAGETETDRDGPAADRPETASAPPTPPESLELALVPRRPTPPSAADRAPGPAAVPESPDLSPAAPLRAGPSESPAETAVGEEPDIAPTPARRPSAVPPPPDGSGAGSEGDADAASPADASATDSARQAPGADAGDGNGDADGNGDPAPTGDAPPAAAPQVAAAPEPEADRRSEPLTAMSMPVLGAGGAAGLPEADERLTIAFAAESTDLSNDAGSVLEDLAERLRQDDSLRLQLFSYAGSTADSAAEARTLSLHRALSVRRFMVDRDIRVTRIDIRALGNSAPGGPADRIDLVLVN